MIKNTIPAPLIALIALIAGAMALVGFSTQAQLGGGGGTINQLDQMTATSSPYTAVTPRTYGKKVYTPGEIIANYFTATSTTATSTFASGIKITSTAGDYRTDPQISFGNGGTGFYESSDNQIRVAINAIPAYIINATGLYANQVLGAMIRSTSPSATNPGFAFSGDTTTGIGQSAAGNISLINSGATTMTLNSTRNVGIGTTSPYSRLHISSGANATTTTTIGEIGLTTSKGCVNMNRADGGAGSFYLNAAGALVSEPNYCR